MAPMNSARRTLARPPPMKLLPRHLPDCRVQGASPARAAICRRSSDPNSGSSAISVRAMIGPIPGTRGEQVFLLGPGRRAPHVVGDVVIQFGQLLLQGLAQPGDALLQAGKRDVTGALAFC